MTNTPDNTADNGLMTRQIVYNILVEILQRKNPMDQVLARDRAFDSLEGRDRAFARMMIATCLRRKGQMDDLIFRTLDGNQVLNPPSLSIILYMGICQILFMEVPDHAAVDTAVQLAEKENMAKQKGFINAVLRRMTTEGKEWVKLQDEVHLNIPGWLLKHWVDDYGLRGAAEIGQASLSEAATDITIKDSREKALWVGALETTELPTGSLRRANGGNITHLQGFDEGAWWVQDASAALPVTLLGDIQGKTAIDLCAAPGGKTAQLAAGGAHVTALDRSAKRLERLKDNMARLKFDDKVETVVGDGAVWQPTMPADIVLLDAPCSATGTLRRHPDVMHLKGNKDVEQLCDIQARLIENAAVMVKPGGTLIYCTCSLQKVEGEQQVNTFLLNHPEFQRAAITADEIGGLDTPITPEGDLRILPYHLAPQGGMDGFYVARLVKG